MKTFKQHLNENSNKVYYHGTNVKFDSFEQKDGKISTIFGNDKVKRTGFFFTENKKLAYAFGKYIVSVNLTTNKTLDLTSGYFPDDVLEALVKDGFSRKYLINLYKEDMWNLLDGDDGADFVNVIKGYGYDSVKLYEHMRGGYPSDISIVVFNSNQIKILGIE